ncbi:MAG: HAMP domain-containing histidine kinase [Clostridiales bacterium]|jgi:signal transduction histidine kinase|nr:HAMP domain-containing histidine kinase [Clostridiales bacterium]
MIDKFKVYGKTVVKGSFFVKYFAVFSAVIIICMLAIGIFLLLFTVNYWRDTKLEMLQKNAANIAKTTANSLSQAELYNDYERATIVICNSLEQISGSIDADIFVCNLNGEVVLCKDILSPDFSLSSSGHCLFHNNYNLSQNTVTKASKGGYALFSTLDGIYAQLHAVALEPIYLNGAVTGIVVATAPVMDELVPFALKILGMFLMASALSLTIISIAVYIFTDRLTKPLREMAQATRHYAGGDFSYRVQIKGNDELTRLITDFNAMAKALETLESSRRNFVANVSHEFKTPITTIGGFINGILDGTIPPEKQSRYLNIVCNEISRLSKLVNTMLNISRIETGNFELIYESFNFTELIFNAYKGFEQSIAKKSIGVYGLNTLPPITINGDRDMINQVIYNLFDNAVKFTNENGEIIITASESNAKIFFTIRNSGTGIPIEDIENVFERFYKADKSRSSDSKSVGLGLHIAKSIIDMHNGNISVKSSLYEYTEFSVSLPKDL